MTPQEILAELRTLETNLLARGVITEQQLIQIQCEPGSEAYEKGNPEPPTKWEGTLFQPGDVVSLKSGGPKMTIGAVTIRGDNKESETVSCEYFNEFKGDFVSDLEFAPSLLEKVE